MPNVITKYTSEMYRMKELRNAKDSGPTLHRKVKKK
jgi:hypothetical protein